MQRLKTGTGSNPVVLTILISYGRKIHRLAGEELILIVEKSFVSLKMATLDETTNLHHLELT